MHLPRTALPRLTARAPLLERSAGTLQVGTEPDAVVLADPAERWRRLLEGCTGRQSIDDLLAATALPSEEVEQVLSALTSLRLLDLGPATPAAAARRSHLRLIGAGRIGLVIAPRLLDTHTGTLYVVDPATPDTRLYPHTTAASQGAALATAVAPGAGRIRPVRHWSKPEDVPVALSVVAGDALEPDRIITEDLARADQPHLLVRPLVDGVVVGPLVVPGRTSCVRCCDLRRRDADPDWPRLLGQLCGVSVDVDPVLVSWAAAVAAAQVVGFLAGHAVETMSGTLELTLADHRQRWRSWPSHPDCGCHW